MEILPRKYCPDCQQSLRLSAFSKSALNKFGRHYYCRKCDYARKKKDDYNSKQGKAYRQKHRERLNKNNKQKHWELRLEMIAAYGGKCNCCGESIPEFLTLEHVNGDGTKHRKELKNVNTILRVLRDLGWPQGHYTVLCYNCNCGKNHKSVCPHKMQPS